MDYILDASAILAHLRGEEHSEFVSEIIVDRRHRCFVHAANWSEVYYRTEQDFGQEVADRVMRELAADRVRLRDDTDIVFWTVSSNIKAVGRISLPDCMCIALALRLDATVVTKDHATFEPFSEIGLCPVLFFDELP
jgi:predicted nucleic acid-binding protein